MALTVPKIRGVLIGDFGPLLRVAGMDVANISAANASLDGPIGEAVLSGGGSLADAPAVTDADILTITGSWRRFMQFSRLYTLERIWGNWPHVDMKSGEESQMLSQLAKRLQERMKEIRDELADPTSIENTMIVEGVSTVGVIRAGSRFEGGLFGSTYGPSVE